MGSGGSGSGGQSSSTGSLGNQKAGFFQDSSQVGSVISGHMDDVPKQVVTRDPVPTRPAGQGVVSPFTKRAVGVVRPMRRRRRKLTLNKGDVMWDSRESSRAKSQAPVPRIRLRQICGGLWRSCDDALSK